MKLAMKPGVRHCALESLEAVKSEVLAFQELGLGYVRKLEATIERSLSVAKEEGSAGAGEGAGSPKKRAVDMTGAAVGGYVGALLAERNASATDAKRGM